MCAAVSRSLFRDVWTGNLGWVADDVDFLPSGPALRGRTGPLREVSRESGDSFGQHRLWIFAAAIAFRRLAALIPLSRLALSVLDLDETVRARG